MARPVPLPAFPACLSDRGTGLPITDRAREIRWRQPGSEMCCLLRLTRTERINLAEGVAAYQASGHDGVIAFGGGSGLDLGKMVAFMAGQTRPVWDFEDIGDWWTRADAGAIAPIIAVPTTAGTGSRSSVPASSPVADTCEEDHRPSRKCASIVIADPELTVGMPKSSLRDRSRRLRPLCRGL